MDPRRIKAFLIYHTYFFISTRIASEEKIHKHKRTECEPSQFLCFVRVWKVCQL